MWEPTYPCSPCYRTALGPLILVLKCMIVLCGSISSPLFALACHDVQHPVDCCRPSNGMVKKKEAHTNGGLLNSNSSLALRLAGPYNCCAHSLNIRLYANSTLQPNASASLTVFGVSSPVKHSYVNTLGSASML